MRDYVEEIEPSAGVKLARVWGYPRAPMLDEMAGRWYQLGQSVVFWFEPWPDDGECLALGLHLASNPERRGELGSVRNMLALEVIAELQGATRLYVTMLGDDDPNPWGIPRRALRRYLRARGWLEDALGMYRDLGVTTDGRRGEGARESGRHDPGQQDAAGDPSGA